MAGHIGAHIYNAPTVGEYKIRFLANIPLDLQEQVNIRI